MTSTAGNGAHQCRREGVVGEAWWCRCRGGAVTVVTVGVCTESMAFDCWPQANHVIDARVAQVPSDKLLQSCRPIARRSVMNWAIGS